jgi:hypothetical protein
MTWESQKVSLKATYELDQGYTPLYSDIFIDTRYTDIFFNKQGLQFQRTNDFSNPGILEFSLKVYSNRINNPNQDPFLGDIPIDINLLYSVYTSIEFNLKLRPKMVTDRVFLKIL